MSLKLAGSLVAAAVVLAGALTAAEFCARERTRIRRDAALLTHGDPSGAAAAIAQHGCGGCHEIPGIAGARGMAAPPLVHFGQRAFIAGELRNTPDNLVRWIAHPHAVEPKTAMPEMGVSDREARDIAAYLYTLQ